jgi:hypothetical protein
LDRVKQPVFTALLKKTLRDLLVRHGNEMSS